MIPLLKNREINLFTVKVLLNANKAALARTWKYLVQLDIILMTGNYDDIFKVCSTDIKVFPDKVLLTAELMELLALMDEEKITVQVSGNKIHYSVLIM